MSDETIKPRPLEPHEQLDMYLVDRSTDERDDPNEHSGICPIKPRPLEPQETLDAYDKP